jgi:dipeptidyl-peptidase-4
VVAGELRSVAERPPWAPRVELTTVGPRHFRAALVRPHDFDPRRRYPVMVYVYAGPHTLQVRATAFNYLMPQWIADQGMVVVMLDGRGTPGRGRAWERVLKGNFIRVPLADQVAGLEALGARYPELDLGRVGIFGWSFGGYFTAMALMQRPEVFTAGVAGAPVVDWRDYDAHYTERFLGLPDRDAAGYQASSVLTYAARLERPLLLIHGTADDNVYPVHSMKLCQALENADKEFEFVPLVGKTHGVSDPAATFALYARIARFFRLHLGQPASR